MLPALGPPVVSLRELRLIAGRIMVRAYAGQSRSMTPEPRLSDHDVAAERLVIDSKPRRATVKRQAAKRATTSRTASSAPAESAASSACSSPRPATTMRRWSCSRTSRQEPATWGQPRPVDGTGRDRRRRRTPLRGAPSGAPRARRQKRLPDTAGSRRSDRPAPAPARADRQGGRRHDRRADVEGRWRARVQLRGGRCRWPTLTRQGNARRSRLRSHPNRFRRRRHELRGNQCEPSSRRPVAHWSCVAS